ncbi:MAG TPA: hypothetical protein PK760_11940 [Flavobacteriales bacterium]|nr:hypothetical protein [Flavobacteriales bacterium]
MQDLLSYNISILEKIDALLVQMNDTELSRPSKLLFGSSIGQHMRHILEFYTCLLTELDRPSFSYDRRQRNLLIESEVASARASAVRSISLLGALNSDRELHMESELPEMDAPIVQHTTLKRELVYLADHGVHHLAMVRISLEQELPHITFPQHLGVAASTRNHHAR